MNLAAGRNLPPWQIWELTITNPTGGSASPHSPNGRSRTSSPPIRLPPWPGLVRFLLPLRELAPPPGNLLVSRLDLREDVGGLGAGLARVVGLFGAHAGQPTCAAHGANV